jgi:hypothetical protein
MPALLVVELDAALASAAGSLFVVELGDTLRFALHPCFAPLVADNTLPPASIVCDSLQKAVSFQLQCGVAYLSVHASTPGPHDISIAAPLELDACVSWSTATFTVLVQPHLQGSDRKSLKHMLLHTQVARLLGPLDAWPAAFASIADGGYNSVYITPVQRISQTSGSAFCVAEQLQLGLSLFDGDATAASHDGALDKLRSVIESCSRSLRMTFVTDIVLNHVALDSPFLIQHPESAYNLNNSPHLNAAAALDASLHSFAQRVLDAEFVGSGLIPVLNPASSSVVFNFDTDADITKFVNVFFTQVFDAVCLLPDTTSQHAPFAPLKFTVAQVIPNVPLLQHYTVDVEALLSLIAKRIVVGACASTRTSSSSSTSVHQLLKALRGRQLHIATDAQLQQLIHAVSSPPHSSTDAATSKLSSDFASAAMLRLRSAAALYNAHAAQDLNDDLSAAADSIRSTMCVLHSLASPALSVTFRWSAGAIASSTRLAPACETYLAQCPF